jgi:hypothetical protein
MEQSALPCDPCMRVDSFSCFFPPYYYLFSGGKHLPSLRCLRAWQRACMATLWATVVIAFVLYFFLTKIGGKALPCYTCVRVHAVGDRGHPVVHHLAPHPDPHGTFCLKP